MFTIRFSVAVYLLIIIQGVAAVGNACAQTISKGGAISGEILFKPDLSSYDPGLWKIEMEQRPGSKVVFAGSKITLDTRAGVTVWFRPKLEGDYEIVYKRRILVDKGANDRLSDMNQFWQANDPQAGGMFRRDGKFSGYDSLNLYYFGIGGNTNKTSRFRRYSEGRRVLLHEYLDKDFLLKANTTYTIRTLVKKGRTRVWVNDILYFDYADEHPLPAGWFGLRSTWSRQEISDLVIYRVY